MMQFENPLPGYVPDAKPDTIDPAHSEILASHLKDAGFVTNGSCKTQTPMTVGNMAKEIRGSRPEAIKADELIGPLVLNGTLQIGNVIGLWKLKED